MTTTTRDSPAAIADLARAASDHIGMARVETRGEQRDRAIAARANRGISDVEAGPSRKKSAGATDVQVKGNVRDARACEALIAVTPPLLRAQVRSALNTLRAKHAQGE